jgi:hypothetical protein
MPASSTVSRTIEVAVFRATLGNCTLDCMRCANSCGGFPQLLDTLKPKSRHAGYRWGLNKGSVLSFRLQCFFRSNSVRPALPPFESGSQSQNSKESSAGVQRREGELHIPDWEKPRNFLFPGASLLQCNCCTASSRPQIALTAFCQTLFSMPTVRIRCSRLHSQPSFGPFAFTRLKKPENPGRERDYTRL